MTYEGRVYLAAIETRPSLISNHDVPDGHSVDAPLRCALGRDRLDEALLVIRTNRNDDLVGRKGCKSVADGERDIRLAGNCINGLAGKPRRCAFGDPLCVTERFLVAGEPVEYALPCDRYHDLDRVSFTEMLAQDVAGILHRADHEDVLAHGETVPRGDPRPA